MDNTYILIYVNLSTEWLWTMIVPFGFHSLPSLPPSAVAMLRLPTAVPVLYNLTDVHPHDRITDMYW
jgi:hypothetical protein